MGDLRSACASLSFSRAVQHVGQAVLLLLIARPLVLGRGIRGKGCSDLFGCIYTADTYEAERVE